MRHLHGKRHICICDFNPRTPCGVRRRFRRSACVHVDFNPRTPCGVRRWTVIIRPHLLPISIHAPLAGCDARPLDADSPRMYFNPRTPCGVRPRPFRQPAISLYFNPRTPCGVRHREVVLRQDAINISIHAPLAGCDGHSGIRALLLRHFNPRTPCGVRLKRHGSNHDIYTFQSTHPLRGATSYRHRRPHVRRISIHAPLAGCDYDAGCGRDGRAISIHAPLAGCDRSTGLRFPVELNFNPRTPCGVRPLHRIAVPGGAKFQSTHPLRGATACYTVYTEM